MHCRALVLLLAFAGPSCRRAEPVTPPPIRVAASDASVEPEPASSQGEPLPSRDAPPVPDIARTPVGDWGVEIHVPDGASETHEALAERHSVELLHGLGVTLFRVHVAAPQSPADVDSMFGIAPQDQVLARGTTPDGIMFAIVVLRVRVGVPGGLPGQHIHTWKNVSRVYAVLPLDGASSVECRGYIEHGAQSASDPDILAANEVCLSMRRRK